MPSILRLRTTMIEKPQTVTVAIVIGIEMDLVLVAGAKIEEKTDHAKIESDEGMTANVRTEVTVIEIATRIATENARETVITIAENLNLHKATTVTRNSLNAHPVRHTEMVSIDHVEAVAMVATIEAATVITELVMLPVVVIEVATADRTGLMMLTILQKDTVTMIRGESTGMVIAAGILSSLKSQKARSHR